LISAHQNDLKTPKKFNLKQKKKIKIFLKALSKRKNKQDLSLFGYPWPTHSIRDPRFARDGPLDRV
jgi:hypothetical protein